MMQLLHYLFSILQNDLVLCKLFWIFQKQILNNFNLKII